MRSLNPHDIVLVVGLVFIAMLFIPLMLRRFVYPDVLPPQVRVLVMVPIVYAIAIVVAIFPKGVWPFAGRVGNGTRLRSVCASGLIAAASALLVSVLFRFAFDAQGNVSTRFDAWRVRPGLADLTRSLAVVVDDVPTVTIAWQARRPCVVHFGCEPLALGRGHCGRGGLLPTVQWVVLQLLAHRSRRDRHRNGRVHPNC